MTTRDSGVRASRRLPRGGCTPDLEPVVSGHWPAGVSWQIEQATERWGAEPACFPARFMRLDPSADGALLSADKVCLGRAVYVSMLHGAQSEGGIADAEPVREAAVTALAVQAHV